jgi:hypothetical protein
LVYLWELEDSERTEKRQRDNERGSWVSQFSKEAVKKTLPFPGVFLSSSSSSLFTGSYCLPN